MVIPDNITQSIGLNLYLYLSSDGLFTCSTLTPEYWRLKLELQLNGIKVNQSPHKYALRTYFINLLLSFGQYPSEWKLVSVILRFKNDNRQLKAQWITFLFLCWQGFSRSIKKVVFFHLYNILMKLTFFINSNRVLGLMTQQLTNWFFLFTRFTKPSRGAKR